MRVLAVETSTMSGGAALLDGERVVGEYILDVRVPHSERLMAAIDQLLAGAGAHPIGSPYARRVQPPRRGPAPAVVGSLGHARLAVGDAVAAADLTPIYLRPSEAELKRRGAGLS